MYTPPKLNRESDVYLQFELVFVKLRRASTCFLSISIEPTECDFVQLPVLPTYVFSFHIIVILNYLLVFLPIFWDHKPCVSAVVVIIEICLIAVTEPTVVSFVNTTSCGAEKRALPSKHRRRGLVLSTTSRRSNLDPASLCQLTNSSPQTSGLMVRGLLPFWNLPAIIGIQNGQICLQRC